MFARGSDNRFLVIATKKSSTGDDTDFWMEIECDSRRRQLDGRGQSGGAKGRNLQVRKTLECGDEEKDKVTDRRRNPPRGVFNDESCQNDVKNKNNQVGFSVRPRPCPSPHIHIQMSCVPAAFCLWRPRSDLSHQVDAFYCRILSPAKNQCRHLWRISSWR